MSEIISLQQISKIIALKRELTNSELINYLLILVDAQKVTMSEIEESSYKIEKNNFVYAVVNPNHISVEEGDWSVFIIKENKKSELYYKESVVKEDGFIWIVFENNTNYYNTNSQLLLKELDIIKGLSFYDYKTKNEKFFNYVDNCKRYFEKIQLLENL